MRLGFRLLEPELDRVFEGQEMHFTPWYRREDYALIREIMEDGEDIFPLAFDEWEKNAECELAAAKRGGTITIPVFIYPEEFFSFCNRWKIPLNKKTRAEFADSRGAASHSMGM